MAIYSCNLASIGRTTHAPGTAGAHLRYISREGASPIVEAHIIPLDPVDARTWMDREEQAARANARLCDKVRVAIPRELDETQRLELVRDFVRDVTGDRCPWMFAIHQSGEDAHNPHAHIVLRDRDLETGKRVLRLSDSARDRAKAGLEPKAVEWIRDRWEQLANQALERAGHDARIDRRTLEAQGIDRVPTIHIGPRGEEVDRHVQRPTSQSRVNGAKREIDYPVIDQGRTRKERNAEIVDLNLERAARSPDFETRTWARFEREQIKLDRKLDSELSAQARDRTREARAVKKDFRQREGYLRDERRTVTQNSIAAQRQVIRGDVATMRGRQKEERTALRKRQHSFWSRVTRTLDFTGGTRRKQSDARRIQIVRHKDERTALSLHNHRQWNALRDNIAQQFDPKLEALAIERKQTLADMNIMHQRGENAAEAKRQLREAAREQERQRVAADIQRAKALTRDAPVSSGASKPDGGDQTSNRERLRQDDNQARAEREQDMARQRDERRQRFLDRDRGPSLGR